MAHQVPVKWMYGGSVEAIQIHRDYPILSYLPGKIINILEKCLVTGFGEASVSNIIIDSSGRATANCNNHGILNVPVVMRISGSTIEAINGDWWVDSISTNSFSFDATDSGLTNITCSGNILTKVAPLDWLKKFTDQNIAVFQSKDPTSRRFYLRVDDTKSNSYYSANVSMYENMTDVNDTRSVRTPRTSNLYWQRDVYYPGVWATSGNVNISWSLIGTSKQFCFSIHTYEGANSRSKLNHYFGDLNSFFKNDYGACIITGSSSLSSSPEGIKDWDTFANTYLSRNANQSISSESKFSIPRISGTTPYFSSSNVNNIPDDKNSFLFLNEPVLICSDDNSSRFRGEIPGMAICSNFLSNTYKQHDIIYFDGVPYMIFFNRYSSYIGHFLFNMKSWDQKL